MAAISMSLSPNDGFTVTLASTPLDCSRALTLSRPSASTWKTTRMRAAAGRHGRNAAQFEARQGAAIGHPLALPLHDVQAHGGLAVLESREVLAARHRQRAVSRDDAFREATHGFQAQRQRGDIQQQPLARGAAIACERMGLNCGAQRDRFVGVDVGERLAPEIVADRAPDGGHPGGAADQHHPLNGLHRRSGVAQRLAHRHQRPRDQACGNGLQRRALECERHGRTVAQARIDFSVVMRRQAFFGLPGLLHQQVGDPSPAVPASCA